MYLSAKHAESDPAVLRQLIRDHPLGLLTTAIASESTENAFPFLQVSHIPFVLDDPELDQDGKPIGLGRLRGHMARANPQAKAMTAAVQSLEKNAETGVLEHDVVVVFTSPVQHYVPPKFYVETKPNTAKAVPTWNYAAVQVYGRLTVYCGSSATATSHETTQFLSRQIAALSDHAETDLMQYQEPWKVTHAPERYIDLLQKAILGIEIRIDRLEGKFKMSQEMPAGDQVGLVDGFAGLGTDVGKDMAQLIRDRGEKAGVGRVKA